MKRGLLVWMREEEGSQLVEFSISVLALLALIFGALDCCRAMYSYHFVTYAAQEGARFAIVHGYDYNSDGNCGTKAPPNFTMSYRCVAQSSDVQNYVKSIVTPGISASNVTVTTTWPGTTPDCSKGCSACANANSQGCLVNVKVTYAFGFMLPFLPKGAITFSGTSSKVVQW